MTRRRLQPASNRRAAPFVCPGPAQSRTLHHRRARLRGPARWRASCSTGRCRSSLRRSPRRILQAPICLSRRTAPPTPMPTSTATSSRGRVTLIGCPKLDDVRLRRKAAAQIFLRNDIRSITLLRMEVPCCGGLANAVQRALNACGKDIPLKVQIVTIDGKLA